MSRSIVRTSHCGDLTPQQAKDVRRACAELVGDLTNEGIARGFDPEVRFIHDVVVGPLKTDLIDLSLTEKEWRLVRFALREVLA